MLDRLPGVCARVKAPLIWLMMLVGFAHPAQAYVLSGPSWSTGEEEVIVDIATTNPAGANQPNVVLGGPSTAQLDAAYIEAMNLWTTNSTFKYVASTNGAVVDPCAGSNSGVKFASSPCSGSFSSTTLAVQSTYYIVESNSSTRTVTVFNNSKDWDIYSGPWSGVAEFRRVAVHELGHGLGLDHSVANSIMYFQAGSIETPQSDDLAGAAALYDTDVDGVGIASDNCPEDANAGQEDLDNDTVGDACDGDIDGDGILNFGILDVSHGVSPVGTNFFAAGPASGNPSFPYLAQSFQASIPGTLSRIDLPLYCPSGDLTLEIREVSGGQPSSTVLATQNYSGGTDVPTSFTGLVEFSLTTAPVLSVGNEYAIVLTVTGECRWFTASSYSGGEGYLSSNGAFWQSIGDFGFQTYMDTLFVDNCPFEPNVLQEDIDGDGIGDACDTDNDNDGLSDSDEIEIYNTDPLNADTDGDGYSDGEEVMAGTNPNVAELNIPIVALPGLVAFALLLIGAVRLRKSSFD